jgi:hypothetical protein
LEPIRDLAAPLLADPLGKPGESGIRAVAGMALLTATQAKTVAAQLHCTRQDEAFLGGLFRSLGEMLVAKCFPQDYLSILAQMQDGRTSEEIASIRVMECSYQDIGQAAARAWNLPQALVSAIHSEPPVSVIRSEMDRLRAAVVFSHEVTEAVHRTTGRARMDKIDRLARNLGGKLGLNAAEIEKLALGSLEENGPNLEAMHVRQESLLVASQMEVVKAVVRSLPRNEEASAIEAAHAAEAAEAAYARSPLGQIEAKLNRQDWDLESLMLRVLEVASVTTGFERAVFCVLSDDRQRLVPRLVYGNGAGVLMDKLKIAVSRTTGLAAAALLARRDMVVCDGSPPVRAWANADIPKGFAVYPIVIDRMLAGCVYLDTAREMVSAANVTPPDLESCRTLLKRIIALRRLNSRTV